MMNFLKKTYPIGLDIGNSSLRMLQLAKSNSGLRVVAAQERVIPHDIQGDADMRIDFIKSAVPEMMNCGRFQGKDVVTALPNKDLIVKSLRTDNSNDQDFESYLMNEASQRFSIDTEEYEIDHMLAGEVSSVSANVNEVILFAVPKQSIIDRLDLMDEIGLSHVSIDALPCALFRSILPTHRREEDHEAVNVLVDVGSVYTTITIGRGDEIAFVKVIPVGGKRFNEVVASRLGISAGEAAVLRKRILADDQADAQSMPAYQSVVDSMAIAISELSNEISLCFRYYTVTFRGKRPDNLILSGGEAYEGVLMDALSRKLGIKIELAHPLRGFDLSGLDIPMLRSEARSEWSVATGLALRGIDIGYGSEVCCEEH